MAENTPRKILRYPRDGVTRSRQVRAPREREYDVSLVRDLLDSGGRSLAERVDGKRTLIVTTPTVARLYAKPIRTMLDEHGAAVSMMVLRCDETSKSSDQVVRVCDRAIEIDLDRTGMLLGIGGGVCTDIVTVAASWIRRGIDYIRIPTTLVGQVDAGIGIKGGVNFGGKKNYIGSFYPPSAVITDVGFLATLPRRHIRYGLAEILKVALLSDPRLLELIEEHWCGMPPDRLDLPRRIVTETVWRSIVGLLDEMEPNLHEDQTHERLADFGHTFSPALEAASGFELHHGEAVAIDMALSAALSARMGLLGSRDQERILGVLVSLGLPVSHPRLDIELCCESLQEAALHRGGNPNLVLPTAIGRSTIVRRLDQIDRADLEAALSTVRELPRPEDAGP